MPWFSAWHTVGLRKMPNGLMDEWDGLGVVLEAEKELEKSLKAPSCVGICDDGHAVPEAACSRTSQWVSPTSPLLLALEFVFTHPGMFLDTQRWWTVYLQSGKKKKDSTYECHQGKIQPRFSGTHTSVKACFSFWVVSEGKRHMESAWPSRHWAIVL